MAKKKKTKERDPSTTVEIKLPPALYKKVMTLKNADRELLTQILQSTFHTESRFGMDHIVFSESKLTKAEIAKSGAERFWKLCEGD